MSVNGPLTFARYLFFSDIVNAPTEELAELASIGALERGGSLWGTTSGSCYYLLTNSAAALLVGRDAPLRLRNWEPARLEQALYQDRQNTAQIVFTSPEPFRAEFTSFAEPAEILVNNRKAAEGAFRYHAEKKRLELNLGKGTSKVTLRYPGWKAPERTPVEPAPEPPITREMEYCLAARDRRPPRELPDAVPVERTPLRLEKLFNAMLTPREKRSQLRSPREKPSTAGCGSSAPFRSGSARFPPARPFCWTGIRNCPFPAAGKHSTFSMSPRRRGLRNSSGSPSTSPTAPGRSSPRRAAEAPVPPVGSAKIFPTESSASSNGTTMSVKRFPA